MPTFTQTITAVAQQDCFSVENTSGQAAAAECYSALGLAKPDNFDAFANLARVDQNLKRYQEAVIAGEKALAAAKDADQQVEAYFRIGTSYSWLAQYPKAIESFRSAPTMQAVHTGYSMDVYSWLIMAYKDNGQRAEACKAAQDWLNFAKSKNEDVSRPQQALQGC